MTVAVGEDLARERDGDLAGEGGGRGQQLVEPAARQEDEAAVFARVKDGLAGGGLEQAALEHRDEGALGVEAGRSALAARHGLGGQRLLRRKDGTRIDGFIVDAAALLLGQDVFERGVVERGVGARVERALLAGAGAGLGG